MGLKFFFHYYKIECIFRIYLNVPLTGCHSHHPFVYIQQCLYMSIYIYTTMSLHVICDDMNIMNSFPYVLPLKFICKFNSPKCYTQVECMIVATCIFLIVVYRSQLFLLLHHDAMLLCMHYVINAICMCT